MQLGRVAQLLGGTIFTVMLGLAPACQDKSANTAQVAQESATPTPDAVRIDGSSTVLPISKAVLSLYASHLVTDIEIEGSGTGSGFQKFCRKQTAINAASRPITATEIRFCAKNQVDYIELPIAFDGVAVVVGKDNDFVDALTVTELKKLWETAAQGNVLEWSDIRAGFPKQRIALAGPGLESGTFDFFTTAIVGSEHASRSDYMASEDDQKLVDFVASTPGALGYFGLAYFIKNQDRLRVVAIDDENPDNGAGPIAPSGETVSDATYQPLARPLFFYVAKRAADRPEVRDFVEFYLRAARLVAPDVGYVALPELAFKLAQERFEQRKTGSIFDGAPIVGLTIEELLGAETVATREAKVSIR